MESKMAHPLSEKAGLDLDMRVSTFLLEPKMPHLLSENAGLDLDMRVSTSVLEPIMAHSPSETTILNFLHRLGFIILNKAIGRGRGFSSFQRVCCTRVRRAAGSKNHCNIVLGPRRQTGGFTCFLTGGSGWTGTPASRRRPPKGSASG